jgi:hypothetical protein
MYVVPSGSQRSIPVGAFDVKLLEGLASLDLPIKLYSVIPCRAQAESEPIGFGFIGPFEPEFLEFGLMFKYSNKSNRTPGLVYKSPEFSIYHAVNTATVITIPRTVSQIEELLTAI